MLLRSISPHRLIFSPVRAFCADTPAPPVGPDPPPPRQALCCTWPSRAGPAGRPASASLHRRTAPRPGDMPPARGLHLCAPPPGPGRARAGLYDRRLGPWPLPDRVRSTSRLPDPAGPGLHCHATHALRGARAAPGGAAATPLAYGNLRSRRRPCSAIGSSARDAAVLCPLNEPAAGPIRARSGLSRDPRFARRARCPRGGSLRRRRRTGVIVTARRARGDAACAPGPRRSSWAQHQLAMCNRPQAKQVSSNESPGPGPPCRELR
jgi:hypothetical protein